MWSSSGQPAIRPIGCAEKKGYSGVAIFTKTRPLNVVPHMAIAQHDQEGRVLMAEFADFYLINVYVPNRSGIFPALDIGSNGTGISSLI